MWNEQEHSLVAGDVCKPELQGQQVQGQAGIAPVGALINSLQLHYLKPIPDPHTRLHLHPTTSSNAHGGSHVAFTAVRNAREGDVCSWQAIV